MTDVLDCVVVGAGPAGLTAAVYLARFRRRFRVLHDDDSRAAWIPVSHNVPGFPEGLAGPALLSRLTAQARRYGADIQVGRVEALAHDGELFELEGGAGRLRARAVLLATGVKDVRPALPALEQAVDKRLLRICPICDAYEAIDQAVGVIGSGVKGAREALFLRAYTDRLTLVHVGEPANLDDAWRRRLAEAGIGVVETPIDEVVVGEDRVFAFTSAGTVQRFDTVYSALGATPRGRLAEALGATVNREGCLIVDDHQQTSVPGLYAAGDLVKGLNQITVSTAEAAIAATDIHNRLRDA